VGGCGEGFWREGGLSLRASVTIDWQQPWWHTYRDIGADTWRVIQAGHPVHVALNAARAGAKTAMAAPPLGSWTLPTSLPFFAPPDDAPDTTPYELHVRRTGRVPTRDNLHDFFNGLVWLCHPRWKARLNQLQAEHITQHGVQATRGPLRDALTLFDESGAVLRLPTPVARDLHARDWSAAFLAQRDAWSADSVVIVGHALLEQLTVAPRKGLTAHALWMEPLDEGVSKRESASLQQPTHPAGGSPLSLGAAQWARKPFAALPVMGVPGWAPSQNAAFYADATVFRPPPLKA
jgi:Protein of unknown function (DUF3025)